MSVTDPIADTLVKVKNANFAKHDTVDIRGSKINKAIMGILKDKGFVSNVKDIEGTIQNDMRIYLKYSKDKKPAITTIRRISKPGLRVYKDRKNLPRVLGGYGIAILSTSKGIMDDEQARKSGLGGEVLCYIW